MTDVANVIMNRVDHPRWWGSDVIAVCLTPRQFDCWDQNDPNRAKILAVTEADPMFAATADIADAALNGHLADTTWAATSYFAASLPQWPYWAKGRKPCAEQNGMIFFQDI
jgi:N-acetylmuramoyl-L-alanine amidase